MLALLAAGQHFEGAFHGLADRVRTLYQQSISGLLPASEAILAAENHLAAIEFQIPPTAALTLAIERRHFHHVAKRNIRERARQAARRGSPAKLQLTSPASLMNINPLAARYHSATLIPPSRVATSVEIRREDFPGLSDAEFDRVIGEAETGVKAGEDTC